MALRVSSVEIQKIRVLSAFNRSFLCQVDFEIFDVKDNKLIFFCKFLNLI